MKIISKPAITIAVTTALIASAAYANGCGGCIAQDSLSALATANVVTPVTISQQGNGLSFGTFAADQEASGVIDSSGHVISGVVDMITPGTPATFNTSGVAGNSYTIVTPSNPVTLTGATSGMTMPATLVFPASPRALSSNGTDSFNVTGTLTVAAGQQVDNYSANYVVSVHY